MSNVVMCPLNGAILTTPSNVVYAYTVHGKDRHDYSTNTTETNKTYRAGSNIYVQNNVTLTLDGTSIFEEGVRIYLGKDARIDVKSSGNLVVNGTSHYPVYFERLNSADQWDQIVVNGNSSFDHAIIEGGKTGLAVYGSGNTVSNTIIRNHNSHGIYLGGELTLTASTITGNGDSGIEGIYGGPLMVEQTTISGNGGDGISLFHTDIDWLYKSKIENNATNGYQAGLSVYAYSYATIASPTGDRGYTRIVNNVTSSGTTNDEIYIDQAVATEGVLLGQGGILGGCNAVYNNDMYEYWVNNNTGNTVHAETVYWGSYAAQDPYIIDFFTKNTNYAYVLTSDPTTDAGVPSQTESVEAPVLEFQASGNEQINRVQQTNKKMQWLRERIRHLRSQIIETPYDPATPRRLAALYSSHKLDRSDQLNEWAATADVLAQWRQRLFDLPAAIGLDANARDVTRRAGELAVQYSVYELNEAGLTSKALVMVDTYDPLFVTPARKEGLALSRVSSHVFDEKYEKAQRALETYRQLTNRPHSRQLADRIYNYLKTRSPGLAETSGDVLTAKNKRSSRPPAELSLSDAYPNPFNPSAVISYSLPSKQQVALSVYDVMGRRVAQLVNGPQEAGSHKVVFEAGHLSSGLYLYRLTTPTRSITKKMMLVK